MRHRKRVPKLGREREHRKALLRNLARDLIIHGRITTTLAKAKAAKRVVDSLIARAQDPSVHSRREVRKFLVDRAVVKRLFDEVAPQYRGRRGGYTRLYRLGPRRGDGAEMAILTLVEPEGPGEEK